MILDSFLFTTQGGREENQDFAARAEKGNGALYVVADGLGGHRGGKEASECVVNTLTDAWKGSTITDAEVLEPWLLDQISRCNQRLLELQQEKRNKMKSTVVALAIHSDRAVWAYTGDSRLYHLRRGRILSVTEDHSVAYKKYKSGEISREQLCTDEDQSTLLRVLGSSEKWGPEVHSAKLESGDAFLLCTDGLWEYVYDNEVLIDSLKAASARDWAELLLQRAIARIKAGNDNLTLLTVCVE